MTLPITVVVVGMEPVLESRASFLHLRWAVQAGAREGEICAGWCLGMVRRRAETEGRQSHPALGESWCRGIKQREKLL